MKKIIYIGETKDFSDKWLISTLGKRYKIAVMDIAIANNLRTQGNNSIIINRLYTSSVQRFSKERINRFVQFIEQMEQKEIFVINSSFGYILDRSRKAQFRFFKKRAFPFIETVDIEQVMSAKNTIVFPCVLKYNISGRNKSLQIIKNRDELLNLTDNVKVDGVIQPLIEQSICYRTEFVGSWDSTFTQYINFDNDTLEFGYTYDIVSTPLSESFKKEFCNVLNKIGVQAFSIEYFMDKNKLLNIVDFNLTSNYPRFFIKKKESQLKEAWLNLIN